jgi:hypothetical protein
MRIGTPFLIVLWLASFLAAGGPRAGEPVPEGLVLPQGGTTIVLSTDKSTLAREISPRGKLDLHILVRTLAEARTLRKRLDRDGRYGAGCTVDSSPWDRLPYADYAADRVIIDLSNASGRIDEAARICKPGGFMFLPGKLAEIKSDLADHPLVAASEQVDGWVRLSRGKTPGTDEWSHVFHNAGNHSRSDDVVFRPPFRTQWVNTRKVNSCGDHKTFFYLITAGGRAFYKNIYNKGCISALDAYDGRFLWERHIHPKTSRTVARAMGAKRRLYICKLLGVDPALLKNVHGRGL